MSDTNLGNSSIELSDIRQLDILLTQCETSSCENICNDCCARLGSLEDDDDTSSGAAAARPRLNENHSPAKIDGKVMEPRMEHCVGGRDVLSNVPILSYVTQASTPTPTDKEDDETEVQQMLSITKLTPLNCDNGQMLDEKSGRNPPLGSTKKYCSKCGGLKEDVMPRDISKTRYFSLDKERSNKISTNLLGCSQEDGGGSESMLSTCRKHCSFEENCGKSGCQGQNGENGPGAGLKSPPSKKSSHRSDNTSSKSNPISSKSSQTSLKEGRSRKNSLFLGDRDSSLRSKISSRPTSRKFSMKGQMLSQSEELDSETREILLGKKIESLHESLKIPEPVEAVC